MRANSGRGFLALGHLGTGVSGSLDFEKEKNWEGEKIHFPNFYIHFQKKAGKPRP